jgi:hypothetical protein
MATEEWIEHRLDLPTELNIGTESISESFEVLGYWGWRAKEVRNVA